MKSKFNVAVAAACAFFGLYQQAPAAVLYDNGPVNGTLGADFISPGFAISDSFTLSTASVLTGVNFGVWSFPGDNLAAVDWAILSTPSTFLPVTATAVVTAGSPFTPAASFGLAGEFQVALDSFSLPNVVLGPGTYYLVLQNAVDSGGGGSFYWDFNLGPSSASRIVYPSTIEDITSQSFQILGDTTPLPGALPLFATGLGALSMLGWRRKRKASA